MSDDDEPAPLRADAARMVADWRDAGAMPRAAQARVWRRLDGDERPAAPRRAVPTWTLTFALAAAAALLLAWWGFGPSRDAVVGRGSARDQASDARSADPQASATQRNDAPPVATPPLPPAELPAPPPPPSVAPTPGEPVRTPASAPSRAPAPAIDASTLAREKVLIQRAWTALAAGDADEALREIAEHQRTFPEGVLAPERGAIRVIARCTKRDADAADRARSWLAAEPRSPLAARVRAACEVE